MSQKRNLKIQSAKPAKRVKVEFEKIRIDKSIAIFLSVNRNGVKVINNPNISMFELVENNEQFASIKMSIGNADREIFRYANEIEINKSIFKVNELVIVEWGRYIWPAIIKEILGSTKLQIIIEFLGSHDE